MCSLVTEMSANPLDNDGIEPGAFEGLTVYHIRIAEAKLTSVPKGMMYLVFLKIYLTSFINYISNLILTSYFS